MPNPLRENMVRRAVARAQHEGDDVTVENVRKYLPGPFAEYDAKLKAQEDFLLDADDIAPYLPAPVVETAPEAPVSIVQDQNEVEPQPVQPPEVRFAAATAEAKLLEGERHELRFILNTAIRDEKAAQTELERIARAFMSGFGPPMSPDQLLKAHAIAETELRRKRAAGEIPGRRTRSTVGPSILDKYAAAQRGGQAGFAGRGYSRGGQPATKRVMGFPNAPQGAGQPGGPPLPRTDR